MLHVPADPGGQRAVLVVLVHRGEVTPLLVAAEPLHQPRFEVDTKPFPLQEPEAEADRWVCRAETRAQSGRSEEHGDESGFEQHAIGLIGREVSGRADECEEAEPADEQARARPEVEEQPPQRQSGRSTSRRR